MTHSLLWITPKWILPADDGSRFATTSLIRSVTKRGVTVDLLTMHGPREVPNQEQAIAELGVRALIPAQRSRGNDTGVTRLFRFFTSLILRPHTPITAAPYAEKSLGEIVSKQLLSNYSHMIFEGVHPSAAFSQGGQFCRNPNLPQVIYRAQNCESEIWERSAAVEKSYIKRLVLSHQAQRMLAFERSLLEQADGIAAISEEDALSFRNKANITKGECRIIPLGFSFDDAAPVPTEGELKVLFLGRLDWPPNRDGLRWFLSEVWPEVAATRRDLHLTIAGSGDGDWLSELLPMNQVTFLGKVPEVEPLYKSHALAIVPIFYGSGTRVKAIEAACFGRPVLSTPMGIEGSGFTANVEYLMADNAAEWRRALIELKPERLHRIGAAARDSAEQRFSADAVGAAFVDLLDKTATIREL